MILKLVQIKGLNKSHSLEDLDSLEDLEDLDHIFIVIVMLFYRSSFWKSHAWRTWIAWSSHLHYNSHAILPKLVIDRDQQFETTAYEGVRTPDKAHVAEAVSPGSLPCTGSSQLVRLVLYPEPTE